MGCHSQQLNCPRAFLWKRPEWTGLNKYWVTTEYWADMCYLHWWWTIAVINSRSIPPQWVKLDYTGSICMCLHTHTHTSVKGRTKWEKESNLAFRNVWERWRRYSRIVEHHAGILGCQRKGTRVLWARKFTCFSCSTQEGERNDTWNVRVCPPSADNSFTSVIRLCFLQVPPIIEANLLFIYIHKHTSTYI